ncbi:MBL fold metallo-hydrolase [Aliikangiella sp. G2MR2-5]|uniref:MBL fold metallo-hydrolase n=1 Tax=Aliikangiella sp. G2MR2-5 TaxID=2788943 RepID=UPI0018A903B9|nr:MBL fold metallo-hydrolase [Aliikangiella sp. G2MR2-5]
MIINSDKFLAYVSGKMCKGLTQKLLILFGTSCWLLLSSSVFALEEKSSALKQVNAQVYVAFQKTALRFNDSNVIIIEGDDSLVIVDANDNLENARMLVEEVKALSERLGSKPIEYVINTHWHSDHTLANAIYKQSFPQIRAFVGHQNLPELIENKTIPQLEEKIKRYIVAIEKAEKELAAGTEDKELAQKIKNAKQLVAEFKQLDIPKPTITFEHSMLLDFKGPKIELLNFGRAHTEGDTIVYLPEQKLLLSGDLFDQLPYAGHGYPSEWLHTLKSIEKLDFDSVVPGHGALQKGKVRLNAIISLLEDALDQAKSALNDKVPQEDFIKSIDLQVYKERLGPLDATGERAFGHFIPGFFERAYQEVNGEIK